MDYSMAIKSALDFIENRVTEDLSLEQVAQVTGFSLPHFRAIFTEATGKPLARYISGRKLSHAAFELRHTGKQVLDIAMDYGFGSHDAFTRAFRRTFGDPPAKFREQQRPISGTLITPGIYGPAVQTNGEQVIYVDKEHVHDGDSSVLYGIAPVSYFSQETEVTPFPSVLKVCMSFIGEPTTYQRLMAVSGAAFRLLWNTNYWDGGNVDILGIRPHTTEPLRRAMQAVGRDFELLVKPSHAEALAGGTASRDTRIRVGDRQDFVNLIKREIGAGRPVIGFGVIGPPEACIIAGYRDGGGTLVGWNFFQDMPEFASGIKKEPCGYFVRQGWYEYPETIAVLAIGEQTSAPTEEKLLIDTLRYALDIMETRSVHDRVAGYAAYDAWAEALLNETEFPKGAPLPMLMERLMCQVDGVTMIGERWRAYLYLKEQAASFPAAQSELERAAELFRQEHGMAMRMAKTIGGMGMGERQARNLGKREVREELVMQIREAKAMNMQAASHMKQALALLTHK